MKVILKRDAFIGDTLFLVTSNPVTISDKYADRLPKDAKVVKDATAPIPKPETPKEVLRDFDTVRANSDAEEKLQNATHKAFGKK